MIKLEDFIKTPDKERTKVNPEHVISEFISWLEDEALNPSFYGKMAMEWTEAETSLDDIEKDIMKFIEDICNDVEEKGC